MKARVIYLLLVLLPIVAIGQFSSMQRQVQMSNQMFAQQNRMNLQMQQQHLMMASLNRNRQTVESKLAKEEKRLAKLDKKLKKQQDKVVAQKVALANLDSRSISNSVQEDIREINSKIVVAEKAQEKIIKDQIAKSKRIEGYKQAIIKNKEEKDVLAKKQEEIKKAKAEKKAASKKEKTD